MAPIHLFSPAADQFPAAPDLYNILKIDPAATDAEVEAKHTRYADYLQSEGFQLMRLEYSREEFEAKITQAGVILMDSSKRAIYDKLHSFVLKVWADFDTNGVKGRMNLRGMDGKLAEVIQRMTNGNAANLPTPTQSNQGMLGPTLQPSIACITCAEHTADANAEYMLCMDCGIRIHSRCWTEWSKTCADVQVTPCCPACSAE